MIYRCLFILAVVFVCSCKGKVEEKGFEKIEHYTLKLKEFDLNSIKDTPIEERSGVQKILGELIFGNSPTNLTDTDFLQSLKTLGLFKSSLSKESQDLFSKVIDNSNIEQVTTEGMYTDLLVYYQNNAIVFIGKINRDSNSMVVVDSEKRYRLDLPESVLAGLKI